LLHSTNQWQWDINAQYCDRDYWDKLYQYHLEKNQHVVPSNNSPEKQNENEIEKKKERFKE